MSGMPIEKSKVTELDEYVPSALGGFADLYVPRSLVWILRRKVSEGLPLGTLGALSVRRRKSDLWVTRSFLIKNISNQSSNIDIQGWSFSSYKPSASFEGNDFGIFFHDSLLKIDSNKMEEYLYALACELDWLKGDPLKIHKEDS